MKCANCGAYNEEDSAFCEKCGGKLQSVQAEVMPNKIEPQPCIVEADKGAIKQPVGVDGMQREMSRPKILQPEISAGQPEMTDVSNGTAAGYSAGMVTKLAGKYSTLSTTTIIVAILFFALAVSLVAFIRHSVVNAGTAPAADVVKRADSEPSETGFPQNGEMDTSGNTVVRAVIPPTWDEADAFSEEGIARVRAGNQWGAIGTDGHYIVQPRYEQLGYFSEGIAPIVSGKRFGYVTDDGAVLVEPYYDNAFEFSDGMAIIVKDGKFGFMAANGEEAIPTVFDETRQFAEGLAPIFDGAAWYYIDRDTFEPQFSIAVDKAYTFSYGMARFRDEDMWGYLDKKGIVFIEPIYESAEPFNQYGTAIVGIDGHQMLIDVRGNIVSEEWEKIWNYSDGMAVALSGGRYGYIDETGSTVLPPIYTDVISHGEGFCPVKTDSGSWGYVNRDGDLVIPDIWTAAFKFVDGYARVERDGRFGLINTEGHEVIQADKEDIGVCGHGMVAVKEDGKWGYYALMGE